jgi:hypothetical protein
MTVSLAVAAEIRRLHFAEHWKRGTIASELGVHFDAVARVLGSFGPKAGTPRPDARVLEAYIPFVDETLARYPRLVATRILDMLAYSGGSERRFRSDLSTRSGSLERRAIGAKRRAGDQVVVSG